MATLTLVNRDGRHLVQQLLREVSDRITVVERETGLNTDMWIDRIAHEVTAGGTLHKTPWVCEKVIELNPALWDAGLWDTGLWGT